VAKTADAWETLATEYSARGLVLVLGAGVSMASGLQSWKKLIRRLGKRCLGSNGSKLVTKLERIGYSNAAIAGILKSAVRTEADFVEIVRAELYRNFPFFDKPALSRAKLVEQVQRNNATLRAVAAFCAAPGVGGTFVPNPLVHAIVNFNLDAILRQYTEFRYGTILLRTVERASATASASKINAYHIHGFFQFERRKMRNRELEADRVVLTEDEYFDFFGKPFGMFTYTLLHMLREHPCFFVGLSMIDENLRRLLHYSHSERVRSYEAEGVSRSKAVRRSTRHFAALCRGTNRAVDDAIQQSLATLGVTVAWLDRHDELPDRLGQVYASTSTPWGDVY
jgi:hypothetical protein